MTQTRTTVESDVFVFSSEDLDEVPEHTCMAAGCGYQPRPYVESSLRMDLWSALAVVTDRDPASLPRDSEGRLIVSAEDVTVVVLCGDSDDKGWAGSPLPDEGAYGGNGCLARFEARQYDCTPFQYALDD